MSMLVPAKLRFSLYLVNKGRNVGGKMADDFIIVAGNRSLSDNSKQLRLEKLHKSQLNNRNDPLELLTPNLCKERYRFLPDTIESLLNVIGDDLQSHTKRSFAISPLLQLLTVLRFLACGTFYNVVGDTVRVSKSTVCRIIRRVCRSICYKLWHLVAFPDANCRRDIKEEFEEIAGMPNVLGCVDGTFIRVKKPALNTSEFICRKGFPALNVQIFAGPDYKIHDSIVKWPGATNDARMFRQSDLKHKLASSTMGCVLGDSAYALTSYCLTPYANPADRNQMQFNKAHRCTQVTVEQTIGILKSR